ncbi:MAG TPA: CocE/NonD family hydrolase [Anaerolineae bacterium]|nr:CocE/NonD family hydrolase [Anaerolineae bacterium]
MKKLAIILFLFALVFTFTPTTHAQTNTYDYTFDDSITVTSFDGTVIAANIFTPISSDPNEQFPVIIFPNSWALEEHEYVAQAIQFAEKGYIVLSYSARGWGQSTGLINVAGPKDMADINALIDWLLASTPADPANIGMAGISYGAGLSLLGAAHDSRVKTVMAMSGWGDVGEALFAQETPRLVWGGILVGSGYLLGDMDPVIADHYTNILTHTDVDDTLAWAALRSPVNYVNEYNNRQTPVYISQNFQDELFQPNAVIDFYEQIDHPYKKLDLNMGVHFSAEGTGLLGLDNEVWNNAHDWFDYWLKGIDTGIMTEDAVSMAIKNDDAKRTFSQWPSPLVQTETFYLGQRPWYSHSGSLNTSPQNHWDEDTIYTGVLSGASAGVPVVSPFFEAHTPLDIFSWIPGINRGLAIVYESDDLTSDMQIAGIPSVDLWIEPGNDQVQLVAHLYSVDNWGWGTLITHAPITLHDATPYQATQVTIDLIATSYNVPAGHHLALAIDTYDPQYGAPTLEPYWIDFLYNNGQVSSLNIPVVD